MDAEFGLYKILARCAIASAEWHVTHHAIVVGWYAVQQHDTAEFFETGDDVAIGRSLLKEKVEVRHTELVEKLCRIQERLRTAVACTFKLYMKA